MRGGVYASSRDEERGGCSDSSSELLSTVRWDQGCEKRASGSTCAVRAAAGAL